MSRSEARVVTDRPGRYGKQLVSHMSHRHGGEWDDAAQSGHIVLGEGRADVSSADGALVLAVEGPAESIERLEDAVGRHLVRFGTRDELVVRWVREDGTAGTEQRGAGED